MKLTIPDLSLGAAGWTTNVQTGGAISVDNTYGHPALQLAFDTETTDPLYVEQDFGADYDQILVRVVLELNKELDNSLGEYYFLSVNDFSDLSVARVRMTSGTTINIYGRLDNNAQNGPAAVADYMKIGRDSFITHWIAFKRSSGAGNNDGYVTYCSNGAKPCCRINLDNDTKTARKLRIGVDSYAGFAAGSKMWIHRVDAWTSAPTDLEELSVTANKRFFAGCPGIVDISAPTGGTVTKVEIKHRSGEYEDITVAASSGTRYDEQQIDGADLKDATLFATTDVYDGCFVQGTARPGALFGPSQILKQDSGVAYLVQSLPWLAMWDASYTTSNNTCELQTFDVYQSKEVEAGTYRIGLPGSKINHGEHTVKVTISGVEYEREFTAEAIGRGERKLSQPGGRVFSTSQDDFSPAQPAVWRHVFANRDVAHSMSVSIGKAGLPWVGDVWTAQMIRDLGIRIANHMWSGLNVSNYTEAECQKMLTRAKQAAVLHELDGSHFVPAQGAVVSSDSVNMIPYILTLWGSTRGGGEYFNDLPFSLSESLKAREITNSSTGADEAERAANYVTELSSAASNSLAILLFHNIGGLSTEISMTQIEAILDAADTAGWRLVNLQEYLAS